MSNKPSWFKCPLRRPWHGKFNNELRFLQWLKTALPSFWSAWQWHRRSLFGPYWQWWTAALPSFFGLLDNDGMHRRSIFLALLTMNVSVDLLSVLLTMRNGSAPLFTLFPPFYPLLTMMNVSIDLFSVLLKWGMVAPPSLRSSWQWMSAAISFRFSWQWWTSASISFLSSWNEEW
jgi:hypothetical protein